MHDSRINIYLLTHQKPDATSASKIFSINVGFVTKNPRLFSERRVFYIHDFSCPKLRWMKKTLRLKTKGFQPRAGRGLGIHGFQLVLPEATKPFDLAKHIYVATHLCAWKYNIHSLIHRFILKKRKFTVLWSSKTFHPAKNKHLPKSIRKIYKTWIRWKDLCWLSFYASDACTFATLGFCKYRQ